jgi:tetratricopeptide (TPR) repeat protein
MIDSIDFYIRCHRFQEAKVLCKIYLEDHPLCLEALNYLGQIYCAQKKYDEAISLFTYALTLMPEAVHLHNNLANIYLEIEQWEIAKTHYLYALKSDRFNPKIHLNCAKVYNQLDNLDQSIQHYCTALTLDSTNAQIYNDLGTLYHKKGEIEKAITHYEYAIKLAPNCASAHLNLGCAKLLLGNWEEGWRDYEWRLKIHQFESHLPNQKRWKGETLEGKTLLIFSEQGFGDTIQFIRYLKQLCIYKGRILFQTPYSLGMLFKSQELGVELLPVDRPLSSVVYDYYLPLLSLPFILNNTLDPAAHHVPYIHAEAYLTEDYKTQFFNHDKFKVGIFWQGNPKQGTDRQRSIPLQHFQSLFSTENIAFYSLQKGVGEDQLETLSNRFSIISLGQKIETFAHTAAMIANLDLVISVDSAVAHLSGAMGKTTWILLSYIPDWRWGKYGIQTFWYPTACLFRQDKDRSWDPVFQKIREKLLELTL